MTFINATNKSAVWKHFKVSEKDKDKEKNGLLQTMFCWIG